MNIFKLYIVLLLGALPCALYAGDSIYRWVDEQGAVHYGDTVPDKYKDNATRKPELKDHPVIDVTETVEQRKAKQRALDILDGEPEPNAQSPAPPANPDTAATPAAPAPGDLSCEQQWEQYNASQACFAQYRNANGSIRAEAFQKCTAVSEPPRCE